MLYREINAMAMQCLDPDMHLALVSEMKKVSVERAALPLFVGKHQPRRKRVSRTASFA